MRAPTVEALTPLARASIANWFFHASKPAAVLPHCAALALLAINTSATKAATVTVLNCPPLVIRTPSAGTEASSEVRIYRVLPFSHQGLFAIPVFQRKSPAD